MTSLNPVYTIGNQIEEVILLHTDKKKKEAHERAKELLELVGINEPEKRLRQYPPAGVKKESRSFLISTNFLTFCPSAIFIRCLS